MSPLPGTVPSNVSGAWRGRGGRWTAPYASATCKPDRQRLIGDHIDHWMKDRAAQRPDGDSAEPRDLLPRVTRAAQHFNLVSFEHVDQGSSGIQGQDRSAARGPNKARHCLPHVPYDPSKGGTMAGNYAASLKPWHYIPSLSLRSNGSPLAYCSSVAKPIRSGPVVRWRGRSRIVSAHVDGGRDPAGHTTMPDTWRSVCLCRPDDPRVTSSRLPKALKPASAGGNSHVPLHPWTTHVEADLKKSRRAGRREASIISCRGMLQSSTSVSPLSTTWRRLRVLMKRWCA